MPTIQEVEQVFFEAMQEGWASDAVKNGTAKRTRKIEIPELPGYKGLLWEDGPWRMLDRYCVTPNSAKSTGTITIWFLNTPVWVMHFGGFYEEKAIEFLKRALQNTYHDRQFIGGRGRRIYEEYEQYDGNPLRYINTPWRNEFATFAGREEILDTWRSSSPILLGYHEYWGISLL